MTPDMACLFFERVGEIEKASGKTMNKKERTNLLMEMVQRGEIGAFTSPDCPELVERKLLQTKRAVYITKKPSFLVEGTPEKDGEGPANDQTKVS